MMVQFKCILTIFKDKFYLSFWAFSPWRAVLAIYMIWH